LAWQSFLPTQESNHVVLQTLARQFPGRMVRVLQQRQTGIFILSKYNINHQMNKSAMNNKKIWMLVMLLLLV